MAGKSYEAMARDGKGESDIEQVIKERLRSGERMIDSRLVQFLVDEIRNLRSVIYYDKSLDLAIEAKKADLKEAHATYELLRDLNAGSVKKRT